MSETRIGGWIQTYTGVQFYPFDPRPEEICIEDVAHSLACSNRFTGHTCEPYSIAQHCVLAAENVPVADSLYALLHDASEAYLADVSSPVKQHPDMEPYRIAELELTRTILRRFGLSTGGFVLFPTSVYEVDARLLVTEARDLMRDPDWARGERIAPFPWKIRPWGWREAKTRFLTTFDLLRGPC